MIFKNRYKKLIKEIKRLDSKIDQIECNHDDMIFYTPDDLIITRSNKTPLPHYIKKCAICHKILKDFGKSEISRLDWLKDRREYVLNFLSDLSREIEKRENKKNEGP